MADDFYTITDLLTINGVGIRDRGVSDVVDDAPVLRALAAIPSTEGTKHEYLKQTAAPAVGFRPVNTGKETDHPEESLVSVNLKYLDAGFEVDRQVPMAYSRGIDEYMARMSRMHLRAGISHAEKQIINGTGNEADGFNGLVDTLNALSNSLVVGAGGTTANEQTSVYAIRTNASETDCNLVIGNGNDIMIGEYFDTSIDDGANGRFNGYSQPIDAWLSLVAGGAYSIGRLCNIHASDTGASLTDALIYSLVKQMLKGDPTFFAMNRAALEMLRNSRTATRSDGADAQRPTEIEGIPIIPTESITSTEAVVS